VDEPDPDLQRLRARLAAVGRCPRPAVRALANTIEERYAAAFAEVGITIPQFTVLSAIGYAGETSVTGLMQFVARDQTTLSRAVDRLRRRGWVAVAPRPEDRRVHTVRLTPEGAAILDRAMDAWDAVRADLDEALGSDAIEQLIELSRRLKSQLDG
jgi:DNA-binding MarR family transcriptional regulator